jgi:hypothetical protein
VAPRSLKYCRQPKIDHLGLRLTIVCASPNTIRA